MGAGGQMSKPPNGNIKHSNDELLRRVPYEKPPFTIGDLKKAVPPHCFNRSTPRAFSYLIQDLTLAFISYYLASNYIYTLPPNLITYLAWIVYWLFQSAAIGGVWVIAHECGHHAFSDYQWLDDTLGFLLHSCLLVPYFSWKYSHHRHHSNTGSLENEEVFAPKLKSNLPSLVFYLNNPPGRILHLMFNHSLGWVCYLMFNYAGKKYDRFACHFDPFSPIYSKSQRAQIFISDVGMLVVTYILYQIAMTKGLIWVLYMYGVPLLILNGGLVFVTYLQHTHPSLPHYDSTEWNWLRGALATVDRDYGFITNKLGRHNIADTHVVHHLFPKMPHYHAMEATKAIKPILKDYYKFDDTPLFKALYREAKECIYVALDDDKEYAKGVFWYDNKL